MKNVFSMVSSQLVFSLAALRGEHVFTYSLPEKAWVMQKDDASLSMTLNVFSLVMKWQEVRRPGVQF